MASISAENLARLQTADRQSLADAVEAVLLLADAVEEDAENHRRSTRLVARRFRLLVEENIR